MDSQDFSAMNSQPQTPEAFYDHDGMLIEPELAPVFEQDFSSKYARFGKGVLTAAQLGIVAAEVTPANEAIRVAAFAAAQAKGLDPVVVGAAYGSATFAIEGAAGWVTANLLHGDHGPKVVEKTHNFVRWGLKKIGLKDETPLETNVAVDAGIAMFGGTAVLLAVNNVSNPERTKSQDKRRAVVASAGIAGVSAVQGYLVSKGIEQPNLANIGVATVAVGGVFGLANAMKRRLTRRA